MSLNLAESFEAVADAVPEREALVYGRRRMTFAELDTRANELVGQVYAACRGHVHQERGGPEAAAMLLARAKAGLATANSYAPTHRSARLLAATAVGSPETSYLVTGGLHRTTVRRSLCAALLRGGTVVIAPEYDTGCIPGLIQDERVFGVTVTGDATARPLASELASTGERYDLSCWYLLGSESTLSPDLRADFQRLRPELIIDTTPPPTHATFPTP